MGRRAQVWETSFIQHHCQGMEAQGWKGRRVGNQLYLVLLFSTIQHHYPVPLSGTTIKLYLVLLSSTIQHCYPQGCHALIKTKFPVFSLCSCHFACVFFIDKK